jgi:hypothetical protein
VISCGDTTQGRELHQRTGLGELTDGYFKDRRQGKSAQRPQINRMGRPVSRLSSQPKRQQQKKRSRRRRKGDVPGKAFGLEVPPGLCTMPHIGEFEMEMPVESVRRDDEREP